MKALLFTLLITASIHAHTETCLNARSLVVNKLDLIHSFINNSAYDIPTIMDQIDQLGSQNDISTSHCHNTCAPVPGVINRALQQIDDDQEDLRFYCTLQLKHVCMHANTALDFFSPSESSPNGFTLTAGGIGSSKGFTRSGNTNFMFMESGGCTNLRVNAALKTEEGDVIPVPGAGEAQTVDEEVEEEGNNSSNNNNNTSSNKNSSSQKSSSQRSRKKRELILSAPELTNRVLETQDAYSVAIEELLSSEGQMCDNQHINPVKKALKQKLCEERNAQNEPLCQAKNTQRILQAGGNPGNAYSTLCKPLIGKVDDYCQSPHMKENLKNDYHDKVLYGELKSIYPEMLAKCAAKILAASFVMMALSLFN